MISGWFSAIKILSVLKSILFKCNQSYLCCCIRLTESIFRTFFVQSFGFSITSNLTADSYSPILYNLILHNKNTHFIIRMIIQPLNGCFMLFTRVFYHPNNHISRFVRCIGYQLAQMVMVRIFLLIFNYNFPVSPGFQCVDINIEISN